MRVLKGFALAMAALAANVAHATTTGSSYSFQTLGSGDGSNSISGAVEASSTYQQTTSTKPHVASLIKSGALTTRGVNLGSWLVTEHWMTSTADFWQGVNSTLAGEGEFTAITKADDPDAIRSHLDYHHQTFINEAEIKAIAAAGLNTVRVPVGYWIVGHDYSDPSGRADWKQYTKGTIKYLDKLVCEWGKKHNVSVFLSTHAAKGSQNGADHSSPSDPGNVHWSAYPENVNNTIQMVTYLANRYKNEESFLGIGLLNEPNTGVDQDVLYQYYKDAYASIRATGSDCVLSIMPLLYEQGPTVLTDFMQAPDYTNVWVEWHPYFIWGYYEYTDDQLINQVTGSFQDSMNTWNNITNGNRLLLGEWCFATAGQFRTDQDKYYEWAQAQIDVLNQARGGWTFWSWRVYEDETGFNGWSLRSVLRDEKFAAILASMSTSTY